MADLTSRPISWTDYLPAEWQSTINRSPILNALSAYINRRPADIEGASKRIFSQPGDREMADRAWLLQQAQPQQRLNPLAAEMLDKGGLLANFLGPGAKLPAMAPKPTGIRAYHSSPHDFDKFDMSKIGTGEGGQWFGFGHYFAGNPETREVYQRTLARPYVYAKDERLPHAPRMASKPGAEGPLKMDSISRISEMEAYLKDSAGQYDSMVSKLKSLGLDMDNATNVAEWLYGSSLPKAMKAAQEYDPRSAEIMQRLLDEGLLRPASGRNYRYDVVINSSPDRFGHLDKPVSQQPEGVQRALSSVLSRSELGRPSFLDRLKGKAPSDPVLMDIVKKQIEKKASKALSDGLREQGVDGFIYRNGMTRGKFGEVAPDSHNYVVFDDKIIEILRKYGLLPPVAAGTAAALNQQEPQQ